jgi:hypothetical protein
MIQIILIILIFLIFLIILFISVIKYKEGYGNNYVTQDEIFAQEQQVIYYQTEIDKTNKIIDQNNIDLSKLFVGSKEYNSLASTIATNKSNLDQYKMNLTNTNIYLKDSST